MSQEQDKIFFRNFSLVLAFIAAMMITFYFIADLVTEEKEHNKINGIVTTSDYDIASANIANGKNLSQTCAVCHGADGNSINPIWPKLGGQHASYIVKQLENFKNGERVNAQMAGIVAALSLQNMNDLALYYESQKANFGSAKKEFVDIGQKIYRAGDREAGIAACMACHGPAGSGNPSAIYPSLSGQHAKYTISQLKMFKTGERNNDENSVMRSIAKRMTEAQIEAVSEYLQGLQPR